MATIDKLTVGQVVWSVGARPRGIRALNGTPVWPVRIVEVLPDGRGVIASWNGNAPRQFSAAAVRAWKLKKPAKETTRARSQ